MHTAAGGALILSFPAFGAEIAATKVEAGGDTPLGDFIRITSEGEVLFQFVKHEMGQGVSTAMAQILAEELCADWDRVRIESPLADIRRYQNDRNGGHDTGGSCTIINQYDLLRRAGATARQMLVSAAAREWNISPEQCYAEEHWVKHKPSSRMLSFGALAPLAAELPVPTSLALKDPKAFTLIGQPKAAKRIPEIATGKLKYGLDTQIPGMLYALIARCPVYKGKLRSYDGAAALKVRGVRKVLTTQAIAGPQLASSLPHDIREGVAVVADSFWAANRARDALRIEWDEGVNGQSNTEDFEQLAAARALYRGAPTGFIGDDNAVANLAHVRKTLRASYVYPHQLHSCMEPLNCTAHVRGDECEIWAGSQAPNLIVSELKRLLNMADEQIRVHLLPSGGGYGRRYYPDVAVEAAFISREAGNVPVKLMWTREDDQQCNLVHHFQHLEYQAALDEHNRLYAWYEKELRTYTWGARYENPGLPQMAYDIPNIRYDFEDLERDELMHSSAWRGVVSHGQWLRECFIDEIAAELKADPYEFRLSLLTPGRAVRAGGEYPISSDRMRRVLTLAAEKAGWGRKVEAGRGMGIASCPYGNTYCAAVAEVSVREQRLTIDRVTVAVDSGRVINPSGAANQVAGGIVWGLTALCYGGVPIRRGRAVNSNFHQNKLLRMNECPVIDVHFAGSSDERPWGLGEVSAPLGVPAVLNAIYAATGKRIRRIPLPAELSAA